MPLDWAACAAPAVNRPHTTNHSNKRRAIDDTATLGFAQECVIEAVMPGVRNYLARKFGGKIKRRERLLPRIGMALKKPRYLAVVLLPEHGARHVQEFTTCRQ